MTQMLMQAMTMLHRQRTTALTMDNDAYNDTAAQMMGDNADDDNAAADVNAVTKTTR